MRPIVPASFGLFVLVAACVPPGNSTPTDAGPSAASSGFAATIKNSPGAITAPFEESFDRVGSSGGNVGPKDGAAPPTVATVHLVKDGSAEASLDTDAEEVDDELGPNWTQIGTHAWHIENGWLCGSNVHNHGVWLNKILPVNARIEWDAKSDSDDGDLKGEIWGDGKSAATSISYTNATSYLAILGGWHNTFHVLARINEHGTDRREIKVDKDSDDPKQKPVARGQIYHFKVERSDSKTVRWSIDGVEMATWVDDKPLGGVGHDHFGFNDWEVKVCFDNVKVTPLTAM